MSPTAHLAETSKAEMYRSMTSESRRQVHHEQRRSPVYVMTRRDHPNVAVCNRRGQPHQLATFKGTSANGSIRASVSSANMPSSTHKPRSRR